MQCERCSKEHDGSFGSGRFCSKGCANTRDRSTETCKRIAHSVKKTAANYRIAVEQGILVETKPIRKCKRCGKHAEIGKKYCSEECHELASTEHKQRLRNNGELGGKQYHLGKWRNDKNSILEVSVRTSYKILDRLKLKCFVCGWDKAHCDMHHIMGKKIENPHAHSNLTYVCPNCHRLIHRGLIKVEELKTFEEVVGDSWKDVYYG